MAKTTHLHLAPRLKNEYRHTSIPFWAFMACYRVNLTFSSGLMLSFSNSGLIMNRWIFRNCARLLGKGDQSIASLYLHNIDEHNTKKKKMARTECGQEPEYRESRLSNKIFCLVPGTTPVPTCAVTQTTGLPKNSPRPLSFRTEFTIHQSSSHSTPFSLRRERTGIDVVQTADKTGIARMT